MNKDVPIIIDPWVEQYDLLICKLKKLGIPDEKLVNPDWKALRKIIVGWTRDKSILKLFSQVHPEVQ